MIDIKTVIQNLPSAIIVVNRDRMVLLSNWVAQEFSGLSESEMIDKRGGEVLGCRHSTETPLGCGFSDQCRFCEIKRAVENAFETKGHIKPFEAEMEIHAIGVRFFKVTVTYLDGIAAESEDGKEVAIITIDDITDFKARERLAAANATIGGICHEMNQPLMAIMGYLELLIEDVNDKTVLPEMLGQVKRLGDITKKMQSLTRYSTKNYLGPDHPILDLWTEI